VADHGGHAGLANGLHNVGLTDAHVIVVGVDSQLVVKFRQQADDRIRVFCFDPPLERKPGQRAVGRTGVLVVVAERPGRGPAHAGLTAARRPVDGDRDALLYVTHRYAPAIFQPRCSSSATSFSSASGSTEISANPICAPGECSSRRSSMLTPASPISVSRRASSPGVSSTFTTSWANLRSWPCLPGMRAAPELPADMVSAMARLDPVAVGLSRAAITASRSSRNSFRMPTAGAAFAPRICTHSDG